jgi:hypothetical protein
VFLKSTVVSVIPVNTQLFGCVAVAPQFLGVSRIRGSVHVKQLRGYLYTVV